MGVIWGGILAILAAGITFPFLIYIFWCIEQKNPVLNSTSLREFFLKIRQDPSAVISNSRKGLNQYLKPIPRPTDLKPRKKGSPFRYLLYGIIIVIFGSMIVIVLYIGTMVTGTSLLSGIFGAAFILFAIYNAGVKPKRPKPISTSTMRLSLALISIGTPLCIWFCLGFYGAFRIGGEPRPWHLIAIMGLLLPLTIAMMPTYTANRLKKLYLPFPKQSYDKIDIENPFNEFIERIKKWSQYLNLTSPPDLLLSTMKGISPHLFGWREVYLVVPADLPIIINNIRKSWPTQADALIDFLAIHELTHIVHGDHRILTWLRSILQNLFLIFIPISFAISLLLCFLLIKQDVLKLAFAIAMLLPFLIGLYWMTYVQILYVNKEREYFADQRAIEIIGLEKASAIRDSTLKGSPLRTMFSEFSKMEGPSLGEVLFIDEKRNRVVNGKINIKSMITRFVNTIINTHPSREKRMEFLGHVYDVERIFEPREHGVATGMMVASIWFSFLLIGYALNYRDLSSLDFILIWICLIVLFGNIILPLRHMQGRQVVPKKLFKFLALSYLLSVIIATISLQAMIAIPMIVMRLKGNFLSLFINLIVLVHAAAIVLAMIFIPRFEEQKLIRTSDKGDK